MGLGRRRARDRLQLLSDGVRLSRELRHDGRRGLRTGGGRRRDGPLTTLRDTRVCLDPEGAHLAALRRLADLRGARVVEVGCGDGRLTPGIAEHAAAVLALDPDADAVASANRSLPAELADRVSYRVASAAEIDVPRQAFDIVVFSWSL